MNEREEISRSLRLAIEEVLQRAIEEGAFPGASWATGARSGVAGHLSWSRVLSVCPDTFYDLASLTKVLWTTPAVLLLVREGKIRLDDPVERFFPRRLPGVNLWHLLTHSSGLIGHRRFWESDRPMREAVLAEAPLRAPREAVEYSCVGFLLLGMILDLVEPADSLWPRVRTWWDVDALHHRGVNELPVGIPVAPTESGTQVGEIHDENARFWPGVATNAGLFGTAEAVAGCARRWLAQQYDPLIRQFQTIQIGTRALGWDTKNPQGSSAGTLFGPKTFGHTGFTGTSLWIDPEDGVFGVLLTNRIHPYRENDQIQHVRPAFYDAVKREE